MLLQLSSLKIILLLFILLFIQNSFALSEDQARHFLIRTSEKLTEENVELLKTKNRDQAFDWLLRNHIKASQFKMSVKWIDSFQDFYSLYEGFHIKRQSKSYLRELAKKAAIVKSHVDQEGFGRRNITFSPSDAESLEVSTENLMNIVGHTLNIKWLKHIVFTNSPFTEVMTLFWSGHFTSSFSKVRSPQLMLIQNNLFRNRSLGNFRELLHQTAVDGAMLVYLDGKDNILGQPNENYARELLELFTLGEGQYSENDVRETARAFTGIRLINVYGKLDQKYHDQGEKVILQNKGKFDYSDVLEILLNDERTALHIMNKLWINFISPRPEENVVKLWANKFKRENYDINKTMRTILTSDQFYAAENRMSLIKSPVEFTLSYYLNFNSRPQYYPSLILGTRLCGQVLFEPPDVRGWIGGKEWITSTTWIMRQKYILDLMSNHKIEKMDMKQSNRLSDVALVNWKKRFKQENWRSRAAFLLIGEMNIDKFKNLSDRDFLTELMISPRFSLK